MWGVESTTQTMVPNTPVVPDFVGGDISRLSKAPVSSVPVLDRGYEDTPRMNRILPRTMSEHSFDIGRSNSEADICDAEVQRVFLENNNDDGSGSEQENAQHDGIHILDPPKVLAQAKPVLSQHDSLISHFPKQDGLTRDAPIQPNFSHKNFDKTLQKMLGTDTVPTLSYTHEDYDKFARPDKPTKTRCKTAKASTRIKSAVKMAKPVTTTDHNNRPKPFDPWSPEARVIINLSVLQYYNSIWKHMMPSAL